MGLVPDLNGEAQAAHADLVDAQLAVIALALLVVEQWFSVLFKHGLMELERFEFLSTRIQHASSAEDVLQWDFSPTGNPPALPEDSRSLTAPGVVAESVFREPLKVYERDRRCNRMKV